MQKAFTLDINKCTGCQACEVACAVENELAPGTSWRSVDTFNARRVPGLPVFHLSLACNHCVDPPCMEHCPALAYSKDSQTGAVTVDPKACIGCKYCTWACPYDAPRYDRGAGVVTKCTFCNDRLKAGQRPACVEQCPTGALQIADLDTAPGAPDVAGFPRTQARPAVRFIALRGERPYPEATATAPSSRAPAQGRAATGPSKVALASEWPLVAFTLITAFLAGVMAAPRGREAVGGFAFVAATAIGAGFSTMHLGRKLRAYRAVANWRRSWLSREIIFFSSFAGISTLHLLADGRNPATGWLAAFAGFATLFAMDRVYGVTRTPGLWRHSAQALLTGAFVLGFVAGNAGLVFAVGATKLALYAYRKTARARAGDDARVWLSAVRIVVGLVLPAALWLADARGFAGIVVTMAALGEVVDRCEFYLELDVPTPRKQLALDLDEALASGYSDLRVR